MDRRNSLAERDAGGGSVHLAISDLQRLGEAAGSSGTAPTIFEPRYGGISKRDSSNTNNSASPSPRMPSSSFSGTDRAPEKKLTLFALRLAVLEKTATGIGALGFIWATVVLLGGFAITLDKTDFWFITIILLIEGTRIFSRSHELEWQHQATWSITDAGVSSFRALRSNSLSMMQAVRAFFGRTAVSSGKNEEERAESRYDHGDSGRTGLQRKPTRTWTSSDVPLLTYGNWLFLSRNVSKLLYWLQILSATACVVLSLMKLIRHDYGDVAKGDMDKRNRKSALYIFYALALAEALLFLMEKAYWEWKVSYCKLLEKVNEECELGTSGEVSIQRFFYDSYSRCVNGSIFDGLDMDMITFSTELLGSSSPDEQLIGIRILRQFVIKERFSEDTLQKIGTNISVIERLVEMLNWKDPQQEEARSNAAEILSKLAGKKQNSLRVAGIPGAMESISSLLQTSRTSGGAADEIGEKRIIFDRVDYGFWTFNHLGLLILKKLARDHDNCGKIGNTRGLLPKIVDFTHTGETTLKDENVTDTRIQTVKRSLQLLKMLASTTGATGKQLRKEISEIVFTVSNIRGILRHGERYPVLQKLGIEILTSLASEEDATERIGGTGGVLKELLNIFFNGGGRVPEYNQVSVAAGEALAMLALESKANCHRILKLKVLPQLVGALEIRALQINAARILRNLCAYSGDDMFDQLRAIKKAAPTVLKAATISAENKLQEVMVGLASQVFRFMTVGESTSMFEKAGIGESEVAEALIRILNKYQDPHIKVPRIRRFAIELAIWMMDDKAANVKIFKSLGLEMELEGILETTSEIESFNIFSGTTGLSRHKVTIHSLVETALKLLLQTETKTNVGEEV